MLDRIELTVSLGNENTTIAIDLAHADGHYEDVDGDGDVDFLLHVRTPSLVTEALLDLLAEDGSKRTAVEVTLTGEAEDEDGDLLQIEGYDTMELMAPGKGHGKEKTASSHD